MRSFTPIVLALAAAGSIWFLAIYGKELVQYSEACGGFQIGVLDEVAFGFTGSGTHPAVLPARIGWIVTSP